MVRAGAGTNSKKGKQDDIEGAAPVHNEDAGVDVANMIEEADALGCIEGGNDRAIQVVH